MSKPPYKPRQPFHLPESADEMGPEKALPLGKHRHDILSDPKKRKKSGELLYQLCKDMLMPPVKSNQELLDRIQDYFVMISAKEIYPTLEHLSLYCGVTTRTFMAWRNGETSPFHDETEMGNTTKEISNRAAEAMHAYDASMAYSGDVNFLAYCFRSKNYYGMRDKIEMTVEASDKLSTPQTPEQIAAYLPDNQIEIDGEVK